MSRNKHSKNRRTQVGVQAPRSGRNGPRTGQRTAQGNLAAAQPDPGSALITKVKSAVGSELSTDIESARGALRGVQQRANEMVTEARDMMVRASESTMRTIKENPMPVAIAGIGIACAGAGLTWLVLSSGAKAAQAATEGASEIASSGSSKSALKSATKSMKQAGRTAGDKITQLAHEASAQGRRVEHAVEGAVSEHPLVVGAALLAAGTAIGLALPRTKLENGWLGRERDHLVQVAQTAAKGAVDKVGSLAKQALSATNGNHAQA